MPIERPVPPSIFRKILELEGFTLAKEDAYNWAFTKDGIVHPVIVPHMIDLVPLEVMSAILDIAKIPPGLFASLREQANV
jgi:hypothetical protein